MVAANLLSAYRYRRQWQNPRRNAHRPKGQSMHHVGYAQEALNLARFDVERGKARYPADRIYPAVNWQERDPESRTRERLAYVDNPARIGLRHVGDVQADPDYWRGKFWNGGKDSGWYADNESGAVNGTVYGVVYQLPACKGVARFVAGYRFAEHDGEGVTLDFGMLFEGERGDDSRPTDTEAARAAGYAADSMAQHAASAEAEYQAAWQAGSRYSDLGEEITTARQEALALLSERRAVRKSGAAVAGSFDAICGAIRDKVRDHLESIGKARTERAKLCDGDHINQWVPGFSAGEKRLREAFNEGAGETVLA